MISKSVYLNTLLETLNALAIQVNQLREQADRINQLEEQADELNEMGNMIDLSARIVSMSVLVAYSAGFSKDDMLGAYGRAWDMFGDTQARLLAERLSVNTKEDGR